VFANSSTWKNEKLAKLTIRQSSAREWTSFGRRWARDSRSHKKECFIEIGFLKVNVW
jgi:hypothetical protein